MMIRHEELGLIQIYNRPMKIQLLDPTTSWQTLINAKVGKIRKTAEEKIDEKFNTLFKSAEPIRNKIKANKSESILDNFFLGL